MARCVVLRYVTYNCSFFCALSNNPHATVLKMIFVERKAARLSIKLKNGIDMNIIPKPQKFEKLGGEFSICKETTAFAEEAFMPQAQRFVDLVRESGGFELTFTEDISQAQIIFSFSDTCAAEGYVLMISNGVMTVSAAQPEGCFYAVETLRQILHLDTAQDNLTCDNCYIEDFPKYCYRGLSVDICRHFFPLPTLKQIVDLMARVKLNKLHLHLSDDQGFRLQIDKYPLLNTISSVRGGSEVLQNGVRFVDETEVSGYLTKAEAKELVSYAAERGIQIVPELDIPGHAVAMLAAYPNLGCEGEGYEVRKKWGISKDILCAGNEETYEFITDVLREVCEVFPGDLVHLGGDEAPKDRWCNCKKCRAKLAELKLDNFEQLQTHMVEQFRAFLESQGKTVICWNDGISKGASQQIISQVWKPFSRRSGIKHANRGRQTIMSPFFNMYFDYPYAMTPLRKTFSFNAARGVKRGSRQNVLGVEGTLWTEFIATEQKLYFNLLPRMLALSECAWGNNTGDFSKRVAEYVKLYDKLGLPYYKKAAQKVHKNLCTVKKFFKKNPDVELDKQNKSINTEK